MQKHCARVRWSHLCSFSLRVLLKAPPPFLTFVSGSESRLAPAVYDTHRRGARRSPGAGSAEGTGLSGHWVCAQSATEAAIWPGSALKLLKPSHLLAAASLRSISTLMSRLIFGYDIAIIFMTDINQSMAAMRSDKEKRITHWRHKAVIMPPHQRHPMEAADQLGQPPKASG